MVLERPADSSIEVYETNQSAIWRGFDGICRVCGNQNSIMTAEEANQQLEILSLLGAGQLVPVLVDVRGVKEAHREFRMHMIGAQASVIIQSVALLIGSPVSRIIGNFMLGLNKLAFPLQLFTGETQALAWLRACMTDVDRSQ